MKFWRKVLALIAIAVLFVSSLFDPTLALGTNNVQGIYHLPRFSRDHVVVYLTGPAEFDTHIWENKLIVDIAGAELEGGYQEMPVSSSRISTIRYSQFDTDVVRVVVDLIGDKSYEAVLDGNSIVININDKASGQPGSTTGQSGSMTTKPGVTTAKPPVTTSLVTSTPVTTPPVTTPPSTTKPPTEPTGPDGRGDEARDKINVVHKKEGNAEYLELVTGDFTNVNVHRLTDPNRIIIDFEGLNISNSGEAINIGSTFVKNVNYRRISGSEVKVEAELTGQHEFTYEEYDGSVILKITKTSIVNLKYHNFCDRVYIEINGAMLAYMPDEGEMREYFTEYYDSARSDTYITFESSRGNLGYGKITINDELLNSISVSQSNGKTTIAIDGKNRVITNVFPRPIISDTAISILRPANTEKLVVIDPGHGGADPGAERGSTYEKNLNLDICLRLNKLLEEKGIKTYMIREDDRYVGVAERAFIANKLNASLFLSVHNNSMTSKSFRGTMTLCYSSGSLSHKIAKIVQRELVESLGTRDCGISIRPELGVLRRTTMPAVLAEVAFLSNDSDLANLKTEAFRQKAAEGLYDAVIEALESIVD
ncbi:MAG: N-acetylmuramoyl-L-alanine amidase [Eubacteriales bacterium]|nr:N-acetylmuramoyl-L-alanine amidase [Eubacteriales bacterium]